MTFGRQVLVAAVVVPLLVGGCAGDPEPKIAPPEPSPSSSSLDPTPTAEPKEEWEKQTKAGAVAFAEHWIDLFSAALQDGRTDDIRAVSSPDCQSCVAAIERLETIEESGGFYRTPGWRVLEASPSPRMRPPEIAVAMNILRGREVLRETKGAPITRNPASRAAYSAVVRWDGGGWTMSDLSLVS